MALEPVRNIAQPNAASNVTRTTTSSRSCEAARPMYSTALAQTARASTARRPKRSAKAPPTSCSGRVTRPATPRTKPMTVIEMWRLPFR